ncbi:MAG: hypothetical protein D6731_15330 [Planctomycetota bacterium]|nr:MAG: hypothetical protein D6731_15330 [Planctomycetota bacterium]
MNRRSFLASASAFLLWPALSGCRAARRRRAVRRAVRRHRRRRRRFRRFVRRRIRRRGRLVPVIVFPVTVQTGDVVVLEEHGECEVQAIEETRVQVRTPGGESVWVEVVLEGEDEGEELPE